jgi:hypothetical protein
MLTAFARKFGPTNICDPNNLYALSADGVDDYALKGGVGPMKGNSRHIWSMWINIQAPYWPNTALRWLWGQSLFNNADEDFIRILYQPLTALNRLEFEFRHSTTANSIKYQWPLHTAANSPITGSTSSTNYWTASNPNINKNSNGYVHLMFIYNGAGFGSATTNTSVSLYWNGQLLTPSLTTRNGSVISTGATSIYHGISINPANLSVANCTSMYMDQLATFSGGAELFMAQNLGLSGLNDQEYVDLMYNGGCPRSIPIDGRYPFIYNFENSLDHDIGGAPYTGYNGITYTSNHA